MKIAEIAESTPLSVTVSFNEVQSYRYSECNINSTMILKVTNILNRNLVSFIRSSLRSYEYHELL